MTRIRLIGVRRQAGGRAATRACAPFILGLAAAVALVGCGSSGAKSKPAAHTSTTTAKVAGTAIPAVAAPANAVSARQAGLSKLTKAAKAGVSAHLGGLGKLPIVQAVETVADDLNHFWSGEFASSGVQWPTMRDVILQSGSTSTECPARPTISATDPFYLCDGPKGGTFYWTIPWMKANIDSDQGGVDLAFNMAEMWSFHILDIAGATTALQQGSEPKAYWAEQAVCLTGVYVYSLNQRNLFEQGDQQSVQEFLTSLSGVNGISSPDVTNAQLRQAFSAGFQSGSPGTCGIKGGASNGGGTSGTSGTSSTSGTSGTSSTSGSGTSGTSGSIPVG